MLPLSTIPEIIERYHALIDEMVSLHCTFRRQLPDRALNYRTTTEYLYACCTVRVDIGRSSGKTQYAVSRIRAGGLIIVATPKMRSDLQKLNPLGMVLAGSEVLESQASGARFSTVFLDEPSLVQKNLPPGKTLLDLYQELGRFDMEQTYIWLGA